MYFAKVFSGGGKDVCFGEKRLYKLLITCMCGLSAFLLNAYGSQAGKCCFVRGALVRYKVLK